MNNQDMLLHLEGKKDKATAGVGVVGEYMRNGGKYTPANAEALMAEVKGLHPGCVECQAWDGRDRPPVPDE